MKKFMFIALTIFFMVNGSPLQTPDPNVIKEIQKTLLCVYFDNAKQILCQRSEIQIQCDAFIELHNLGQNSIRFLGISQQTIDNSNPELVKYFVHPREENTSTYLNYSISVDGKPIELVLYHGEKSDQSGLRIPNLSCWNKLLDVLKEKEHTQKVKLTDTQEEISLIGEIFLDNFTNFERGLFDLNNSKNKRWGYAYYYPWSCYYGSYFC